MPAPTGLQTLSWCFNANINGNITKNNNKFNVFFSSTIVVLSLLLLSAIIQPGSCRVSEEPVQAIHDVTFVQGQVAKLPCDVEPTMPNDVVTLVMWSRNLKGHTQIIYTYDARGRSPEQGQHWANDTVLGGRAAFRYNDSPSMLLVDRVVDSDSGIYICRVDFKSTPTRNVKVNLTVILPPERIAVLDDGLEHNVEEYILGPYNEGSSVNLTCESRGGRPLPAVTWWLNNALIDDTYEVLSDKKRVRNVLQLTNLTRSQLHAVYTCQAVNNHLAAPLHAAVVIDLNLKPLEVRLVGNNRPMSAGKENVVECEVRGARPHPEITWWKGSTKMANKKDYIQDESGNFTISALTFVPKLEDAGKYLSCRAVTKNIAGSGKEDGWKLEIHHAPQVTLELGSNLNGSVIKEGVDVYFECNIKSNPWVYRVVWMHEDKQLFNNATAGTIVSNQSLVLQSVTRERAGMYVCVGYNSEGMGRSNSVKLDVKFAPVCVPGPNKALGIAKHETARIRCDVEANPENVTFFWKFNNTVDTIDIPLNSWKTDATKTTVKYTPMSDMDYGTLLCYGRNEIGMQKEPCVFYINPAGKPDPVANCTLHNQTSDSLHVECNEGFDGGLPQEFVMEVFDLQSSKLVSNVSSKAPVFTVGGLESGLGFVVGLYAVNKKGRSDVTRLQAFTLKSAEKHTGVRSEDKPPAPDNCTVAFQNRYVLQVRCVVPHHLQDLIEKYLLQVYDAHTRVLLGTATSQRPDTITITSLPRDHRALLLFIRSVAPRSTISDAFILYAPAASEVDDSKPGAGNPVFLQITPILGALIGVVAALILVAIIIVVVIRLRGGGERDDKDYDDGGLSSSGRRCAGGDKASTEPLNKDLNDSVDSLEEKNPDIIPQNNGEDDFQDEERAFERLNNAPLRVYSRLPSPNNSAKTPYEGGYCTAKKNDNEITYAELSLTNQQLPHVIYNQQAIPMTVMRRPEPTVYAQLDMSKRMPPCLQTLSPPHPSAYPMHHPHMPQYVPRGVREEQMMHDGTINAETPLLNPRDITTLQPLIDQANNARTGTLTSTQPRVVTATRF